jgi:extradiol dioxygenase family protein
MTLHKLLVILGFACLTSAFCNVLPFHMSMPVQNLNGTQDFYENILGAKVVKVTEDEISLNFYGHSLVFRVSESFVLQPSPPEPYVVEGKNYEGHGRHFGLVLEKETWQKIRNRLHETSSQIKILAEFIKNEGTESEIGFMMILDPAGYAVELKYLNDQWLAIRDDKKSR